MKRILIAFLFLLTICAGGTFLLLRFTVAWASDLPNRIHIEVDEKLLTAAVTGSIRLTLQAEDSAGQLQAINCLADCVEQNPEAAAWVRDEFYDELLVLQQSSDAEVASASADLLELSERVRE